MKRWEDSSVKVEEKMYIYIYIYINKIISCVVNGLLIRNNNNNNNNKER